MSKVLVLYFDVSFLLDWRFENWKMKRKRCGLYMRVSTEDQAREEKADLIMRYVKDIELTLVGNEVILKQINFRDSICKPCQELYDKGYIDITKLMILGNVLGSVRFSNYLPDEEVCEIIMRLQQYYDVHFTEATYYLQKQMFIF